MQPTNTMTTHCEMTQPKQQVASAERILMQLKEGDVIELDGIGKTFTKWAGLVVAPDMEAVEWMKANVDAAFFDKYVVRIMHASPERFSTH